MPLMRRWLTQLLLAISLVLLFTDAPGPFLREAWFVLEQLGVVPVMEELIKLLPVAIGALLYRRPSRIFNAEDAQKFDQGWDAFFDMVDHLKGGGQ